MPASISSGGTALYDSRRRFELEENSVPGTP